METWTEYAVRWDNEPDPDQRFEPWGTRQGAERIHDLYPTRTTVVGRQVTASDWLPVDQGGAS